METNFPPATSSSVRVGGLLSSLFRPPGNLPKAPRHRTECTPPPQSLRRTDGNIGARTATANLAGRVFTVLQHIALEEGRRTTQALRPWRHE